MPATYRYRVTSASGGVSTVSVSDPPETYLPQLQAAGFTGTLIDTTGDTGEPAPGAVTGPLSIPVRMKDGTTKTFTAIGGDLDAALKDGGRVLDLDGKPMIMTPNAYGGWLAGGLPLNVVGGGGWVSGQKEALTKWYDAGWRPGMPAIDGKIHVRMPDGSMKDFDSTTDPALEPALRAGGRVKGPSGQLLTMTEPFGRGQGWLAGGRPLNVIQGLGYTPEQQQVVDSGELGGELGVGAFGGTLSEGFQEEFNYPGIDLAKIGKPFTETFKAPGSPKPIRVKAADGTIKSFSSIPDVENAIRAGGKILDASGNPMVTTEPFGPGKGFLANDLPLNVWMGHGLLPGQAEALKGLGLNVDYLQGIAAQQQSPQYSNTTAVPAGFTGGKPLAAFASKTGMPTYTPQGELPAEFAGGPPLTEFKFDTADLYKDPGYQFRVSEMDRAIGAQHSAQQNDPMGGRALREIAQYRGGLASQEYGAAYERAQLENQLKNAKSREEYDRLVQQYQLKFGRSQEQYARGVTDVGIQSGLSNEAYNREKEAYASSVAQDEAGYRRALLEYDSLVGQNREQYQRGVQDFGLTSQANTENYGRALSEFLTRNNIQRQNQATELNANEIDYRRKFGEFATKFDIDRANKTDVFSRFATLAGFGGSAGVNLGQLGGNFADRSGSASMWGAGSLADIWGGIANAQAGGRVGSANAWSDAFNRTSDSLADIYTRRRVYA